MAGGELQGGEGSEHGVIRVGVAGWDYPDWKGVVYPSRPGRAFDRLAHMARYVDAIEVNSTFYRPIAPERAESWLRRVESARGFVFTAKSHRSWTHEAPVDLDSEIRVTLTGLEPLRAAGRLGALLIQFPQSFRLSKASIVRLERLHAALHGWPAVFEVRHASWETDRAESWFRQSGAGWCVVDQPRIGRSTARAVARVIGTTAYLRLHGRNQRDWFRPDAGRDARYDYLYAEEEIEQLAATARELDRQAEQTFVVQNNHFRGQALVNALQMKRQLSGEPPEAPEQLVAAYPALARHVRVERRRLF